MLGAGLLGLFAQSLHFIPGPDFVTRKLVTDAIVRLHNYHILEGVNIYDFALTQRRPHTFLLPGKPFARFNILFILIYQAAT